MFDYFQRRGNHPKRKATEEENGSHETSSSDVAGSTFKLWSGLVTQQPLIKQGRTKDTQLIEWGVSENKERRGLCERNASQILVIAASSIHTQNQKICLKNKVISWLFLKLRKFEDVVKISLAWKLVVHFMSGFSVKPKKQIIISYYYDITSKILCNDLQSVPCD